MQVHIFQQPKTTTQSGRAKNRWVLVKADSHVTGNDPLMGWVSGDTDNQIKLSFTTRQQAEDFALKNGWEFDVARVHKRKVRPRNYLQNF